MSLFNKISKDLENEDTPEEVEHDLIKDSVLEIVNSNFKVSDDFDELPVGDIRRNVCEDLSSEYKGKPVSRKSFTQRNWIIDNSNSDEETTNKVGSKSDESDGESYEEFDEGSDNDDEAASDDDDNTPGQHSHLSSINTDEDEEESDGEDDEKSFKKIKSQDLDINIFSSKIKNIDEDVKKGNSIKNQLVLWENLMECRIKLQKGLCASNRLMQKDVFSEFKSELSPEEKTTVSTTCQQLIQLLEQLIQLKKNLLKKCPDHVTFSKKGNEKNSNSDDEITSESDEDNDKNGDAAESSVSESPPEKKRKTIQDYSEYLLESSSNYKPFRDSVIQKWNDKTRLASGKVGGISKFAILEQSTLKQIEQILLDKDRLLKRTQIRRSKLPVLGKQNKPEEKEEKEEDSQEEEESKEKKEEEKELDSEIFDDDDFYHKLLKDFIERKTSDVTDATQLGRQWTKLQKLRSKMKRKIDTRATKGRKIRYTVHNKLVNFMAPVPYSSWEDKVQVDLFASLFGQASQALPAQK